MSECIQPSKTVFSLQFRLRFHKLVFCTVPSEPAFLIDSTKIYLDFSVLASFNFAQTPAAFNDINGPFSVNPNSCKSASEACQTASASILSSIEKNSCNQITIKIASFQEMKTVNSLPFKCPGILQETLWKYCGNLICKNYSS